MTGRGEGEMEEEKWTHKQEGVSETGSDAERKKKAGGGLMLELR